MTRISLAIAVAFLASGTHLVAQGVCGPALSAYVEGNAEARLQRISELHSRGLEDIPVLLRDIHNSQTSPVTLENPFLSIAHFRSSPVYCGAVAAYLVETIVGLERLPVRAFAEDSRFLLQGTPQIYVFQFGHIVVKRTGKPVQAQAMAQIARLYADWWKGNAHRSLASLRSDWRNGKRPLAGSPYEWQ